MSTPHFSIFQDESRRGVRPQPDPNVVDDGMKWELLSLFFEDVEVMLVGPELDEMLGVWSAVH